LSITLTTSQSFPSVGTNLATSPSLLARLAAVDSVNGNGNLRQFGSSSSAEGAGIRRAAPARKHRVIVGNSQNKAFDHVSIGTNRVHTVRAW
jgi:cyanophycinase-like exopeptidase